MQIEIQSNNKTLSLKTDFKGTNLLIIWKIVVGFKFLQSIFIQIQYSKKNLYRVIHNNTELDLLY